MRPPADVAVEVLRWPDSLTLLARRAGREVGRMNVILKPIGAKVVSVTVDAEHRRLGVATQLYQAAAREACGHLGAPLVSGVIRSPSAEGFWQKQVARGRAVTRADPETGQPYYALACPAPRSLGRSPRR